MGYAILTKEELNNVDTDNLKINGKSITYAEHSNVAKDLFLTQGDQFTQYTKEEVYDYIQEKSLEWNGLPPRL
tara:strand:+ start:14081 stop:14299 length:219 start_codon:yes stop_codon:yes gene_type:complete